MSFINDRNIKTWSTIGQRATLGIAALELAKKDKNLIVITCDVSTSAGLDRFRKTLPEQYLDVGIAEQNMIGVAAGLSSENFKVLTTTFAPFQTIRCCEQIKVNFGYMNQNVCMVGIASGLVLGNLGFTHCCIEDIGILRTIPNITIISPSDTLELVKSLSAALEYKGPCYLRLTGGSNNPIVNNSDYNFKIGKANVLKTGDDITIFSTGSMVYQSLEAAKILEKKNIYCEVVNIHTIKPIDTETILKSKNKKLIVSVEEHNIIGGLGSAISEVVAKEALFPKQIFIGVNDEYGSCGSYQFMLEKYGLTAQRIVNTIVKNS